MSSLRSTQPPPPSLSPSSFPSVGPRATSGDLSYPSMPFVANGDLPLGDGFTTLPFPLTAMPWPTAVCCVSFCPHAKLEKMLLHSSSLCHCHRSRLVHHDRHSLGPGPLCGADDANDPNAIAAIRDVALPVVDLPHRRRSRLSTSPLHDFQPGPALVVRQVPRRSGIGRRQWEQDGDPSANGRRRWKWCGKAQLGGLPNV